MPARRAAAPAVLKRSAHSRQSSSDRAVSAVKLGTIRYSWPSRWAMARLRSHPTSTTAAETCAEIGPLAPIVQRPRRVRCEARHDQVLVAQPLGDGEAPLPPDEHDGGRDVR